MHMHAFIVIQFDVKQYTAVYYLEQTVAVSTDVCHTLVYILVQVVSTVCLYVACNTFLKCS